MNKIKLHYKQLNRILIVGILTTFSCEDNIQQWELQIKTSPTETGLVVMQLNDTQFDTLDNSQHFDDGTELFIEARPIVGWKFDHWKGDIEHSDNPTQLLKDDHKTITAVFNILQYSMSVDIVGEGKVVEEVVLGKTNNYEYGTNIKLTAIPESGWKFEGWSGDLTGTDNPKLLTIEDHKSITAKFKSSIFGSDSIFTFVALGQSNMVGVGDGGGDLNIDVRVKTWNNVDNKWIVADPSKSLINEILFDNYHSNHNNLAFHFAKQIAEFYDIKVRMLIVAKPGLNIGQFISNGNKSTHYDKLKSLMATSIINEVDCILWHQGESNNFGEASVYTDSLQIVIDNLRAELEIGLTTPFIAGELIEGTSRDIRNDVYINFESFIADDYAVSAKLHNLPGIFDDKVHFTGSSLVIGGRERYFESFQSLVK